MYHGNSDEPPLAMLRQAKCIFQSKVGRHGSRKETPKIGILTFLKGLSLLFIGYIINLFSSKVKNVIEYQCKKKTISGSDV